MVDDSKALRWRNFKHSVRGTSHERSGQPNQDYCGIKEIDAAQAVIAAVADGHGSRNSFRSDRGARFAVESAIEELDRLVESGWRDTGGDKAWHTIEIELPQRIVSTWQRKVDEDLKTDPISFVSEVSESSNTPPICIDDPNRAYGSTLLAALLLPTCAVYLQLGDGEILVVDPDTGLPTRPVPADAQNFANETASLASTVAPSTSRRPGNSQNSFSDFRVRVSRLTGEPPALVLLTSDGYPNAFVSDSDFLQVATDLLRIGHTDGWDLIDQQLPEWLREASCQGSGDDVTLVLLIPMPGQATCSDSPAEENSSSTSGGDGHDCPESTSLDALPDNLQ